MTTRQRNAEIKELNELLFDLLNEAQNQHPQPNGDIYLHGTVITVKWINEVLSELHTYNIYTMDLISQLPVNKWKC